MIRLPAGTAARSAEAGPQRMAGQRLPHVPEGGGIGLKASELEQFVRQLTRMLKAGLTLDRSLSILSARQDRSKVTAMAADLRARLRAGMPVATAMNAHPESFPRGVLALIKAGDASGRLANAMADVEQMIVARNQMSTRMRSAMLYPGILTMVALGSVLTILLFVIPKFKDLVINQWDGLPLISRLVFQLSDWAVAAGWLLGAALAVLLALLLRLVATGRLEAALIRMMSALPGIGPVAEMGISARLLRIIGTQLSCAVPLPEALAGAVAAGEHPRTRAAIEQMRNEVRGGIRLSQAMRTSRLFPETALQLAEVGEEAGDSGGMLRRAAELIEEDVERAVKRIFILFEPMLLVVLGLVIGALLYGLFSAILTLNQTIG